MPSMGRRVVDVATKRIEIQNEIEQSYADLEQHELNNHQYESVQRNILLVGHSRSGKTTLGQVLADPRNPADEFSLRAASQTEARCEREIHLPSSKVILNIVELPETMINSVTSLHKINEECHRLHIQDFHLICFCASFDAGINGQALQSFERFISYFGQEKVRENLCLIVTRCETKDEEQREKLRNELREDVDYKRISQDFDRGIHFSGAINRDDWNLANESLLDQFETVYYYRKNLLDIIRTDVQPFHISEQQQQQQEEQPSLSRSTSEDSLPSTLTPVIQSVTLPRMESFEQPNMLNPRRVEPQPTVRLDLHPVDHAYEQPNMLNPRLLEPSPSVRPDLHPADHAYEQPNMLSPRLLEPSPSVRPDLHLVDQAHEQSRPPSKLNAETPLLKNKHRRQKCRNCRCTICALMFSSWRKSIWGRFLAFMFSCIRKIFFFYLYVAIFLACFPLMILFLLFILFTDAQNHVGAIVIKLQNWFFINS